MGETSSTIYSFPWPKNTKEITCGIGLFWGSLCCFSAVCWIFAGQRACKAWMLHCIYFVLQSGILELEPIKHCIYNLEACETKAFPTFYFHSDTFSNYCNILSCECGRERKTQISWHGCAINEFSYAINEFSYALELPSACRLLELDPGVCGSSFFKSIICLGCNQILWP